MAMNDEKQGAAVSSLYGAGLIAVYFGERLLDAGKASTAVAIAGAVLVLGTLALRGARASRSNAFRSLLLMQVAGTVALALYFLNSTHFYTLTGRSLEQALPRVSGAIAVLWPVLLLVGTLPLLFAELSLATMRRAPFVDRRRVNAAILSGVGVACALVFSFSAAYVASERDVKVDLSYFRTARAGEATKKIVRALDAPVTVALFFPPANEVREEVESYFSDVTGESKQLIVERYDHALHPAKARELGVTGNGVIVIGRGTLREQIPVPLQLESARNALKKLDQDVNKRLIGVTRPNRVAYFTQGHRERTFSATGDTDQRPGIQSFKQLLTDLNLEPRELGLAQGLGTEVPSDASMVLIIGPKDPFSPEEVGALSRYLDKKGRLFVALDSEESVTLDEILGALGVKYHPVPIANDQLFLNRTYEKADRTNLAMASYSSHASVSTVSRFGMRAPMMLLGSGHFEKLTKEGLGLVNVDFTVHAHNASWSDLNRNFELDEPDEARKVFELAAAISKRTASALDPNDEARLILLGDSDGLSDLVFSRALGNVYFARDALRWLSGDEGTIGAVNTEEDVPISHTRKQDTIWFYSSVFASPAVVLALGWVMSRRKRATKRRKGNAGPASGPASTSTPTSTSTSTSTEVSS